MSIRPRAVSWWGKSRAWSPEMLICSSVPSATFLFHFSSESTKPLEFSFLGEKKNMYLRRPDLKVPSLPTQASGQQQQKSNNSTHKYLNVSRDRELIICQGSPGSGLENFIVTKLFFFKLKYH